MTSTFKPGTTNLVLTAGVSALVAEDNKFAAFVWKSLARFSRGDWGSVGAEDWQANDEDLKSLNSGGWYGRILASYEELELLEIPEEKGEHPTIWIIRNTAEEDGTQAVTVLFPEEY